jgi:hypothetical protein
MADFAANLISNTEFTAADVEGGTISAELLTNTAILIGAVGGGTVASVLVTVPAVLTTGDVGGGSVASSLVFFGDSRIINRVFDTVANKFVTWPSILPDRAGTRYPGPGVFGVTTSGYVVLSY